MSSRKNHSVKGSRSNQDTLQYHADQVIEKNQKHAGQNSFYHQAEKSAEK
ncbi:hypothetical protein [Marinicrinis sediminis]|uniref:DUF3941 domain-containing protein n=1 Tax=Marinicrinis sediminis TaxID=1652465 RepID=A0ABW5RDY3_9BACL